MSAWVLVLTMWATDYKGAKAIHSIEGFASKESCLAAGTAWLQSAPKDAYRAGEQTALCFQKGK